MTASLFFRITHQFRMEWRHHRVWVVAWALMAVLHQYLGNMRDDSSNLGYVFGEFALLMMVLLPATMAWLCIRDDSPSNTDCATLTRPVGQGALWLGKGAFLCCGVVLPLLVVESRGWAGFQFSAGSWMALGSGLVLCVGLVIGTVGTLTALASSSRQIIAIAVMGVLVAGLVLTGGQWMLGMMEPVKSDAAAEGLKNCGRMVAGVVAFLGSVSAWWVATVPRRRVAAAVMLVLSLMQAPVVSAVWKKDWITPPALKYAGKKIGLKTGKADPADKEPGRALWPTLRITGLGKDEVASVIDLAPVSEGQKEWPPLGSYSDLVANTSGIDAWLHLDHLRALLKHSAPTTLWNNRLYNNFMYNGRARIQVALSPLNLDAKAMPERWRLRLAIHEMRKIGGVPFKELWRHGATFPVREGVRVEFSPFVPFVGAFQSKGWLHHVHSLALPPRKHRPAEVKGQALADGFLLVLEDPELRENEAFDLGLRQRDYGLERYLNLSLQADESQEFEVRLWTPAVQHELLKTTHEDWVNRVNATLWYAEERGTIDLELTAAQMAEVLAEPEPKTEVKKP
jgi:hypothetical protein